MRGPILPALGVAAAAAVLTAPGCFRGEFLDNTCEGLSAGCTAAATTESPTTAAPTTTTTDASTTDAPTGSASGTGSSSTTSDVPDGFIEEDGVVFRIDSVALVDPYFYVQFFGCESANGALDAVFQEELDQLRTNILLVADDPDPFQMTRKFIMYAKSSCMPMGAETWCFLSNVDMPTAQFSALDKDEGNCFDVGLLPLLNPMNSQDLNLPTAPCVQSPQAALTLEFAPGFPPLPLYAGQFAAEYTPSAQAPEGLLNAVLFGFLTRTDAEMIDVSFERLPPINLWSTVGGTMHPQSCPGKPDDRDFFDVNADMLPDEGVWLFLNFSAAKVRLFRML